jgi:subtilisin family serine protease
MRSIIICSLLTLLLPGPVAGAAADPRRLDERAASALADGGAVRLFVAFRLDPADRKAGHGPAAVANALFDAIDRGHATLVREFEHIDAMAIEANAAAVERLLVDPRVLRIDLDAGGQGGLSEALPLAGIAPLHLSGLDGSGRTIAVLDSGHAAGHAAFAGRIAAEYCYCSDGSGCCPNGQRTQSGGGAASDDNGHGSNVSGIALGSAPRGAAPEARLVSIKVIDRNNRFCCSSDIVAGLDRLIAAHPEVDVVNLSLGSDQVFASSCDSASAWAQALAQAVALLEQRGTLVVAASLNRGNTQALPAPACLSRVLAVGAVWDADLGTVSFNHGGYSCTEVAQVDHLTCFSNTSSMLDLVAPGARITAAGRVGTSTYSGTSQASPLVAGCAALLRQAVPAASRAELVAALKTSEVEVEEVATGRRFPRLDCSKALATLTQSGDVDEAQVGTQYWVTGAGIPDDRLLGVELYSATGTAFGAAFDPAALQRKRWGRLEIGFDSCDAGDLRWDSTGPDSAGFGAGGYRLQRIASTSASRRCNEQGLAAMEGSDWMAGSWYGGAARDGEGIFLDVLANGVVVVAFFTHRPAVMAR